MVHWQQECLEMDLPPRAIARKEHSNKIRSVFEALNGHVIVSPINNNKVYSGETDWITY